MINAAGGLRRFALTTARFWRNGFGLAAAGVQAKGKWPNRPIRLMTPFAPGDGTLGAGMAVNAASDGYTFILVSGSYGANVALHTLPYDSVTGNW